MSRICFQHLVAWWSPLITQLRTRTNPSVSYFYGFSSDYSHFYPPSACAVKSSLLKLYESVLISRSCETTFSIFHISQMPPSSCVSPKNEAHCSRCRDTSCYFWWGGPGGKGANGRPADMLDLVFVQWSLTGAARAGLRCNNGKPTFQKQPWVFMVKLLLLVLVLLFYDVIIK